MHPNHVKKRLFVLGNGAAGAENQAIALANRLKKRLINRGIDSEIQFQSVTLQQNFQRIPPLIHVLASLASKKRTLGYSEKMKSKPSSSDVVIGCGRTTVGLCASFKQLQVHERPFTIQIQHPRVPLSLFDAVIIPRHDLINTSRAMRWLGYYHSHVYQTFGTVVDLPQEKLDLAASVWSEKLKLWLTKSKRIVLLVGGPCRGFLFDSKQTQAMIQHLCTALQAIEDVSLLVTFSRRTPLEVQESFQISLAQTLSPSQLYIWNEQGDNPYLAFLAYATAIVTTPDSISMVTEAVMSRKPVFVLCADQCKGKFQDFHRVLQAAKCTSSLDKENLVKSIVGPHHNDRNTPSTGSSNLLEIELDTIVEDLCTRVLSEK